MLGLCARLSALLRDQTEATCFVDGEHHATVGHHGGMRTARQTGRLQEEVAHLHERVDGCQTGPFLSLRKRERPGEHCLLLLRVETGSPVGRNDLLRWCLTGLTWHSHLRRLLRLLLLRWWLLLRHALDTGRQSVHLGRSSLSAERYAGRARMASRAFKGAPCRKRGALDASY